MSTCSSSPSYAISTVRLGFVPILDIWVIICNLTRQFQKCRLYRCSVCYEYTPLLHASSLHQHCEWQGAISKNLQNILDFFQCLPQFTFTVLTVCAILSRAVNLLFLTLGPDSCQQSTVQQIFRPVRKAWFTTSPFSRD